MTGLKWGILYLLSVLFFSFIYYTFWKCNPDSFIINSDLNVHPFYDINKMLWDDAEYDYKLGDEVNLKELKKENDEYVLKRNKDKNELVKINDKIQRTERELNALYEIQNNEIDKNKEKYEQEKLSPFIIKERKLGEIIANLEKELPQKIKTEDDVRKIQFINDKRVELATVRLEKARQSYNNADFFLHNIASFMSQETREKITTLNNQEIEYHEERFQLEKMMRDSRSTVIENIGRYINRYRERVDIIDFFYFSIGISTTTTFGDIVASDKIIRAVVSIQLILCILIVGGFVNSILKK